MQKGEGKSQTENCIKWSKEGQCGYDLNQIP